MDTIHAFVSRLPGPSDIDVFLLIGIVLIAGAIGGFFARLCRFPAITGNFLGGIIIGPSCLGIIYGPEQLQMLQPISVFAMGLITVSVGSHLSYRRIHNAIKRITWIALLEVAFAVCFVVVAAKMLGVAWPTALLMGAISAATAPGTIIATVRENRGKGTFVKTLLSVVAIDNIICVFLFAMVSILVRDYYRTGEFASRLHVAIVMSSLQFAASIIVGLVVGWTAERVFRSPKYHSFSTLLVAMLLCTGVSSVLGLSPLLSCLFFGVYLGNKASAAEELAVLEPIEPVFYVCFFTLAGASLHLESLSHVGVVCIAYIIARVAGKSVGAILGGHIGHASKRISHNIPFALVPQAGVAIGLVILIKGDAGIPADISNALGAVIIAAVTINEIIGPLTTKLALSRSKEVNKDRPRLMEFLHEEFILVGLEAGDKWDAIKQLVVFLAKTHRTSHVDVEDLYKTVVEREKDISTAIGKGVAIPHGRIEHGPAIQGVLGISHEGIDFDSPDDEPVHIMALIVTPDAHEDKHLSVMAGLSAMVSDELIRTRLKAAINANDAWEIIEGEETRDYNYFLGEED
ncbi:hypothetical protein BVX94_01170 [bacterium B17]|nr:hypothetical protein BVX94_01170 [bacterium B17]